MNFIEQGIRDGISQCSNKNGKANKIYTGNEFLSHLFRRKQLTCDCNFEWLDSNNFEYYLENVGNIADDSETWYIFEIDLELHKVWPGVQNI